MPHALSVEHMGKFAGMLPSILTCLKLVLGLSSLSNSCKSDVVWHVLEEVETGMLFGRSFGKSFGKSVMSFEVVTWALFDPMSLLLVQPCC